MADGEEQVLENEGNGGTEETGGTGGTGNAASNDSKIVTIAALTRFKANMNAIVRDAIDKSAGAIKDDVVSGILTEDEFADKLNQAIEDFGAVTADDLATDDDIDALFAGELPATPPSGEPTNGEPNGE